jgi:hypothetical protein
MSLEIKQTLTCGFCGQNKGEKMDQEIVFEGAALGYVVNPYAICPRCRQSADKTTWDTKHWKLKWRREAKRKVSLQEFRVIVNFVIPRVENLVTCESVRRQVKNLLEAYGHAIDVESVQEVE